MAGVYFSWGNIKTKEFQLFRPKYMFYDKRGQTPFVIKVNKYWLFFAVENK